VFTYKSADLPLTHHNPPFRLNFAVTGHLPQTQPACLTGSFALPIEQKKPPVKGEPLNVGHVPQMHSFMFSGVFGTTIPYLIHHFKSCLNTFLKVHVIIIMREQFEHFVS